MVFKKDHKINIGRKHTEETKKKMSKSHKGILFSKEHIKKLSLSHKGKPSSFHGKHHSEETKIMISKTKKKQYENGEVIHPRGMLGKKHSEETIRQIINNRKWYKHSEETKKKISLIKSGKKFSINHKKKLSISHIKAIKKGIYKIRPNKPEKQLIKIIKENSLPFNYVGNGTIWFRKGNHAFNPDFLSKNPKHIIELFGDYFHNLPQNIEKDKKRLKIYSKYGYKTLIIWEHELKDKQNVINRIKNFLKNV